MKNIEVINPRNKNSYDVYRFIHDDKIYESPINICEAVIDSIYTPLEQVNDNIIALFFED